MHQVMQHVERYLMSCRELADFCSHNGWIDPGTMDYEIIELNDHQVIAFVQFEKIVMEDADRAVRRIPCQGHLRLTLDRYGQVLHAELL